MKKLCLLYILLCISAYSNNPWILELQGGLPYNPTLPLKITQRNYPDIKFNAHFRSEPFTPPVYWVWRIGKWKNNSGWELESIHHKLFLQNPPSQVQEFSISHGYNITTINKAYRYLFLNKHYIILRVGAGLVLAHPENTIRKQYLSPHDGLFELGYYASGPAINLSVSHQLKITNFLFINLEAKFTPSYSIVPISDGKAYFWNCLFSINSGIGLKFNRQTDTKKND